MNRRRVLDPLGDSERAPPNRAITPSEVGNPNGVDQVNSREDFNISEKDTVYWRLSYSTQTIVSPSLAPNGGNDVPTAGVECRAERNSPLFSACGE